MYIFKENLFYKKENGAAVSSLTESLNFDFEGLFKENYGVLDLRNNAQFEQAVLRLEQEVMNGGRNQEFRVKLSVLELFCLIEIGTAVCLCTNRTTLKAVYQSSFEFTK